MREAIEDRNLIDIQALISPRNLKAAVPTSPAAADTVVEARRAIRDVIHGRDANRLVVVIWAETAVTRTTITNTCCSATLCNIISRSNTNTIDITTPASNALQLDEGAEVWKDVRLGVQPHPCTNKIFWINCVVKCRLLVDLPS